MNLHNLKAAGVGGEADRGRRRGDRIVGGEAAWVIGEAVGVGGEAARVIGETAGFERVAARVKGEIAGVGGEAVNIWRR